ncbi:MAG: sulfatase-like hydrolase/transferase [Verrucomicrobiota bacterium]
MSSFRFFLSSLLLSAVSVYSAELPNILWITSEDNGPQLGCYGDDYAVTPNLDALAAKSLRYTRASSNAPVCAPARTTVITGIYPPATGAEHMRSMVRLPEGIEMFPVYLRELGYYTTNRSKEDYNVARNSEPWDVSSGKGHWSDRAEGQPFFAVINETISHESKIRNEMEDELRIHDPAKAPVPAYHPDTPEVRKDWAQYYDRITQMDALMGQHLADLEEAGLSEETIVVYWGDHGSGMPRSKRWPYNSGLNVPMMIHIPEKFALLRPDEYEAGGESDRRVSFVDLAPTMLSLVGIEPKEWMQGHAFAGEFEAEAPKYSFGFRGRMDERIDLVRAVMGDRYVYLRHYHPHRIYGQYIQYMFQTPTTQVWHDLYEAGELNEAQSHFWERKPTEELYDLKNDRWEVNNLAESAEHAEVLAEMRGAANAWAAEIRDVGFLPEAEFHARAGEDTPYEMAKDTSRYDFDSVFAAAQLATSQQPAGLPEILELLKSGDSGVRYWGAVGLLSAEEEGYEAGAAALRKALDDESGSVAVVAAESLARFGSEADRAAALDRLIALGDQAKGDVLVAIAANNAIDYIDDDAASRASEILELPREPGKPADRIKGYVGSLLKKIEEDFAE